MINFPPRGLIADLVTPLDEEGRPDREVLVRIMGRLKTEVRGFLAGSVIAGEGLGLGLEARLEVLAASSKACAEGQVLIFEVTGSTEEETISLLSRAGTMMEKQGQRPEVLYLLTPLVYHGNRDLPDHIRELGRLSRQPLILSNNPDLVRTLRAKPRRKNIRTSVLKKLAANEQITGLEFDGDLTRALNYQRALKSRTGFRFYDGNEQSFLEKPSSSGLISCGANILPQAWADIVDSSLNVFDSRRMSPDHLSRIWQSGQAVRSLIELYKPNPPAVLKAALKLMGVIPRAAVTPGVEEPGSDRIQALETGLKTLRLI